MKEEEMRLDGWLKLAEITAGAVQKIQPDSLELWDAGCTWQDFPPSPFSSFYVSKILLSRNIPAGRSAHDINITHTV